MGKFRTACRMSCCRHRFQRSILSKLFPQAQASAAREIPEYLSAEEGKFSGKLLVRPETDQIPLPLPVNIALVCDFLAHIS